MKAALRLAQKEKCSFCESHITHIDYGDVEHFRPKGGTRQFIEDALLQPGYYWLAYEWSNLFLSCTLCNQKFKENLFPLTNPEARARNHNDDIALEAPLLVDPTVDAPGDHIRFNEERCVGITPKGSMTVTCLGLDRTELRKFRAGRLRTIEVLLDLVVKISNANNDLKVQQSIDCAKQHLKTLLQPSSDYSAMFNSYLAEYAAFLE